MGSLRSSMNKEEQMTLFLEIRKRERIRDNQTILRNSNDFDDAPLGSRTSHSPLPMYNNAPTTLPRNATTEFLHPQNSRNDYDWLMTPPETPVFPTRGPESRNTLISLLRSAKDQPPEQKSRLVKPQEKNAAAKTNLPAARKPASSNGLNTSIMESHKSSSSVGSRTLTPIRRPSLSTTTAKSSQTFDPKSTRTPTNSVSTTITKSRSTIPSSKAVVPPPRTSSPISKATVPSPRTSSPVSKATVPPPRMPSPISKATHAPTPRTSSPISKTTLKSSTPSTTQTTLSSRTHTPKRGPILTTTVKNPAPVMKPRPLKPTDMPGFSSDVPPNLRTSLPERLKSGNRGRPGVPTIRSSSVDPLPKGKIRRQSCSPDRGSAIRSYGSSVPALNRLHAKANDNISPVMVGNQMVERLVNMRKLAPPKQEDKNSPAAKSSPDSSGFGRTLSKKSLDMAMRHMDIKRSVAGNLHPLMSNIPASSIYSVRAGPGRSKTIHTSESNK